MQGIILHVEDDGDNITTQVSDTGIGIREEDLERIFESFAAIKKSTYIKGTGLGLSVTKSLVEAHEGKIWAENRKGNDGSVIRFLLKAV